MTTLHLVSHTHWDREWYLPYQAFRLKLVDIIDNLINLLKGDTGYAHFMLDGQTIVLEDYLAVRPGNEFLLHDLVTSGKLSIGPWYILPDEFLVSPEATIRNLLQGQRTCQRFGRKMQVGYIPDPFGHIAQMPQILAGFGIPTACFQRGLSDEPCELIWEAPDGSRVLVSYLRDGYGNAAYLSLDKPGILKQQVLDLKDSLQAHSQTSHFLLMQGTDHTWPEASTPAALEAVNTFLEEDIVVHSTLESYFRHLDKELSGNISNLPVIHGDMRSSKRSPLLPGVLSARMWIKQRNHHCQDFLEKWAEPFCVLAEAAARVNLNPSPVAAGGSGDLLRAAWRLLMECHPHDSICGCSIDQVHTEMSPRFDQVEQIGEALSSRALAYLASLVDTQASRSGSVVAFNPHPFENTGRVRCLVHLPGGVNAWLAQGGEETPSPVTILKTIPGIEEILRLDRQQWLQAAGRLESGEFNGQRISAFEFIESKSEPVLTLSLGSTPPGPQEMLRLVQVRDGLLAGQPQSVIVRLVNPPMNEVEFLARDVPGLGWKAYHLIPSTPTVPAEATGMLENEFFQVTPSSEYPGRVDILDKRSQVLYPAMHYFTSGGEKGDEYNYCPPEADTLQTAEPVSYQFHRSPGCQSLEIQYVIEAPAALNPDRKSRSRQKNIISIHTRITLQDGVDRIDIHATVMNTCQDHRLRVHFPAPFRAEGAWSDGHFLVFSKPFTLEAYDGSWIEQPRPESYQRMFTTIQAGKSGLTVANQGLPEVEVVADASGRSEIALTLLRCVGWLSRPDLSVRKGNAGPSIETPGAQMQGLWEFDYSIIPHRDGWENAYQAAAAFCTPMRAVTTPAHPGPLPSSGAFMRLSPPQFALSALKPAEDGDGIVLRGFNLAGQPLSVEISPSLELGDAYESRLDESITGEAIIPDGSTFRFDVRRHGTATIRFKPPK